jgi:hypothetical protein
MRLFVVPVRNFLIFKSCDEISFKGEGCDVINSVHGLNSNSNSNPSMYIKPSLVYHL